MTRNELIAFLCIVGPIFLICVIGAMCEHKGWIKNREGHQPMDGW